MSYNNVPEEYSPISPWGYFGLNILFAIPFIGFLILLILSFASSNINVRNYARSFWIPLLLVLIGLLILFISGFSLGQLL